MSKDLKQLLIFLAATFAWTWGFYAPIAMGQHSPYEMPWMILFILGGMGPSLVGLAMVFLTYDKLQRADFWRRCFSVKRIGVSWWAVIFLIFPLLFGLSVVINRQFGGALPGMKQFNDLMANPVMWPLAAFISFMSGPWSEEFGWRGFALDRFIRRQGAFWGSIVLGLVWAVWHLPLFWMPATWHGQIGFKLTGFWMFILFSIGLSLIMTWIYLNTNRSILSGMLLHFTANFTSQLMAPSDAQFEVVRSLVLLVIGLVLGALLARALQSRKLRAEAAKLPA